MLEFLKLVLQILMDNRGEDNPEPEPKPEPKPGEGEPEPEPKPAEGEPEPKPEPEPEPKPENRYEGFFDHEPSVEEVFTRLKEVDGDHRVLTGKTTKTESNLAEVRKTLKEAGISVFFDNDGKVKLGTGEKVVEEKPTEKKRRFTDEHRTKFNGYFEGVDGGKGFLETLTLAVQDIFDDQIEEVRTNSAKEKKDHDEYLKTRVGSAQKLVKLFPNLMSKGKDGKDNPNYNAKHHDLALEIYEREYCTKREDGTLLETHPNGQLWGALEAATELGINPTSIAAAKAEGVKIGKDGKKVLGKVGGGSGAGQEGKKSQEEYLKLTPEERVDYDKKQMGI